MLAQDVGVLGRGGLGARVAGIVLGVLPQFVLGFVGRRCRFAHGRVLTHPQQLPRHVTRLGGVARVGDEVAQRAARRDAQFNDQQLPVGVELADGLADVAFAEIGDDQRTLS